MTNKSPAFQMYCNDWLASPTVIAMTPIQELAYFRMLLFMWQSGDCSIPDNADTMAKLTRTDANTCSIVFELAMIKHPENASRLTNNRLFDMWSERLSFVESRKRGGLASGESRKKAGKTTANEQTRTRVQLCSNINEQVPNSSSSSSDEDGVSSERKKRNVFQVPQFSEVESYIVGAFPYVDPEAFFAHYEANGWMVGKNRVKDWKACVRGWNARNKPKEKPKIDRCPWTGLKGEELEKWARENVETV